MTRKLFVTAMSVLLLLGTTWSCKKEGGVDRGDINAAIKLSASQITASSVVIGGISAQDNVTSCYYLSPVPASEAKMYDMDAIEKKAYILEHGKQTSMPIAEEINKQLRAGTEYTVAAIGMDAQGVFRTAPYYLTFKTAVPEAKTSVKESDYEEGYKYNFTINLNDAAKNAKYIVSTDGAVQELDEAGLKAYIEKGGADVKSTAVSLADVIVSAKKTSVTVAAIPYDDMDRAGAISVARIVVEKVKVIDVEKDLQKTKDNYYEGIVSMPSQGSFVYKFNNKEYGFMSYSGNGGVGTVEHLYAAVPYYNLVNQSESKYMFKVEKSVGRLTELTDDATSGLALWTNMEKNADVKIVFDNTYSDKIPRYYLEVVNTDANRVFYEGFDLFVVGGFYQAPVMGSAYDGKAVAMADVPTIDGTEAAVPGTCSITSNGIVPMTYGGPVVDPAKDGQPTATFIHNRGLEGWQLKRISEFPGFAQLGNSQSTHFDAYFVTPKMSALTGATNVILETATYRFAGNANIKLAILGAGKFTKCTTTALSGTKAVPGTYNAGSPELSASEFTITGEMLPKEGNNDKDKSILKISIEVEGATADTQFKFYVPDEEIGSNSRIQFDYVNVYKK